MKSFSASILSRFKLPSEGRLLAAFSGGEDSLFLLSALSVLAPERSAALYINHNIRGEEELEREIALNRKNASLLAISFDVVEIPRGTIEKRAREEKTGIEAAARFERYNALHAYAEENGFDWILTAHHQDDQTETLLMRIADSSPFWQWGGIRERDGIVVRPMLGITKSEIRSYIRESGLEFSIDSTNSDTSYRRNYIRSALLPLITEREKTLLSRIAENVSLTLFPPFSFSVLNSFYALFDRNGFLSSLPPVREKALLSVFSAFGEKKRVSRRYLSEIEKAVEKGEGRVENERYIFYVTPSSVKAYRKIDDFSTPFSGEQTSLPDGLGVELEEGGELTLRIDGDILSRSLIRKNRKGDEIELVDGKRKISSLLKERKVPYALILETDGEITASFTSFLGGRDRLSSSLRGREGKPVSIRCTNYKDSNNRSTTHGTSPGVCKRK